MTEIAGCKPANESNAATSGHGSTLWEFLNTLAHEAVSDSERALQASVYVCPYCDHILSYTSESVWDDWRKEPTGGVWACPNCLRGQCCFCRREATTHRWGYESGGAVGSAPATWREDVLLCSHHEGGYKRRTYGKPLWNVEPLGAWLDRCVWTSPLYLMKHVEFLRVLGACHA